MATTKIEIDTAGSGTMTRTRTITAQHLNRFINALRAAYNLGPTPTDLQVLETWADRVFDQARELTRVTEKGAQAASVTDIDFT